MTRHALGILLGVAAATLAACASTEVTQYDLATVETNVFEVKTDRLVWSGVTETFNPTSVAAETPGFADVIIKALTDRGLLQKAK
jgi:hypothetical protein